MTSDQILTELTTGLVLWPIMLVLAGGVFLLAGWRIFKVLVMANAMALGVLAGMQVGGRIGHNMDIILGVAGGLILAAAAWPLMKYAVSVMGALAGAAVGYAMWRYGFEAAGQSQLAGMAWVGALIGLITLGLLAFIIFKAVVIVFTSLQGAGMLVFGLLGLLRRSDALRPGLEGMMNNNTYLLPIVILLPAILGGIFQQSFFGKHGKE